MCEIQESTWRGSSQRVSGLRDHERSCKAPQKSCAPPCHILLVSRVTKASPCPREKGKRLHVAKERGGTLQGHFNSSAPRRVNQGWHGACDTARLPSLLPSLPLHGVGPKGPSQLTSSFSTSGFTSRDPQPVQYDMQKKC